VYAIIFFSFLLLIKSGYDCDAQDDNHGGDDDDCEDKLAFGVAAAVISLGLALLQILIKLIPQLQGPCACWHQYVEPFFGIAMFVIWVISTCVLTMPDHENDDDASERAPYQNVGTAYVSIWGCMTFSTLIVIPAMDGWWEKIKGWIPPLQAAGAAKEGNPSLLLGCFLLSLSVLWCAGDRCEQYDDVDADCDDEVAWAVSCSLISMLYCFAMLLFGKCLDGIMSGQVVKYASLVLALWWYCGLAVFTVTTAAGEDQEVFTGASPANGFFGTWGAFLVSAVMAASHFGVLDLSKLTG